MEFRTFFFRIWDFLRFVKIFLIFGLFSVFCYYCFLNLLEFDNLNFFYFLHSVDIIFFGSYIYFFKIGIAFAESSAGARSRPSSQRESHHITVVKRYRFIGQSFYYRALHFVHAVLLPNSQTAKLPNS